jgi:hypothetical protein
MRRSLRKPSLLEFSSREGLIVLVASVGLAAASTLAVLGLGDREEASLREETTGSITGGVVAGDLGRPLRAGRATLPLSDEQRGHIFDVVMRLPGTPVAHVPAPELADALSREVPLQDLPAGVTREIPLVQGHKFVKFDDRILVVHPASRLIVAMIPRYKLLP